MLNLADQGGPGGVCHQGVTFRPRWPTPRSKFWKWMVSAIGIQTVVIIGAVIALVRVVPHQ